MRRYLISEPYHWLQRCFFQPTKFRQEIETSIVAQRLIMMLRLVPLLFLYAYTPAIITRIILYSLRPSLFDYYAVKAFVPFNPGIGWFLLNATWAAALGCLAAALIGGIFSLRLGIAAALALTLANGIVVNTSSDTVTGTIFGIAFGLMLGITFNSANTMRQEKFEHITTASTLGVIGGLIIGLLAGITGGYLAGYTFGTFYQSLAQQLNFAGSGVGFLGGGIASCAIASLLGLVVIKSTSRSKKAVANGVRSGIVVATIFGLIVGIPVGDKGSLLHSFTYAMSLGISAGSIIGSMFLLCYLLSYYRLPFYPISAYSTFQAYLASRNKLQLSLYCLQHSSLHWDECVFLPLPYLKEMLLLAAEQSLAGTLEEINFIIQERPQQRWAAQATAYELALRDLQGRTILRDIALAHRQLAVLIPQQIRDLSLNAGMAFRHLDDASREAASYHAQINKRDRQEALARMSDYLKNIHTQNAFRSDELNQHLTVVVNQWSMLAEQGKETLGSTAEHTFIDNPYAPGNPLELRDPLFVGRDDIAQRLGQALHKRNRPTFLLTGERRMGKSSIIKQLPILLGPSYVPAFYDLQSVSMLSSTTALLGTLAKGITRQLRERGMLIAALQPAQLAEAQQQSELAVYAQFSGWLAGVEQILEQRDRTLILAFDEFEKLEDAERRGHIDLNLLFDFFRNIIQNHSRLALLFSGAKMVGDMGQSWVGYFVNVEHIKVSFLREPEAYDLIIRPVPQVFSEEVVRGIMDITRCHPFLIQAVCKAIIEQLNDSNRSQATLQDVTSAIIPVFDSWTGYFWDQWNRSDTDQSTCLKALHVLKRGDIVQIIQQSGLNKQQVLVALEKLQWRDIVTRQQDIYQFAVPIFAEWIAYRYDLLDAVEK